MEVKPGYKQTDVGVIPEDWELKPFSELFAFRNGVNADKASYGQGVRFINVLEPITYSHIHGPEVTGQVTLPESVIASYAVRRGDVLFNRTSETQEEVALAATYLGCERVVFGGFVIRGRPLDRTMDPVYSGYALRAPLIRSQIIPMGQGAIRANVGQQNLGLVIAPVPPLPEQRAIAKALSDVDGLLGGLDRLIAKKRDLKQAAMQQLLTGQTRLPGFHGEWEVKRLGDAGKCLRGVSYKGDSDLSTHDTNLTNRLLRSNNVQNAIVVTDEVQFVNAARVSAHQILKKGDILICMANGSKALVGKAGLFVMSDGHEYTFGAFMGCFRTSATEANPTFVFYLFLTGRYRDYINNLLAGSSINNLRPSSIESLEFPMSPLPEQTAIAAALTDMDAELAALEQRREKTRALKQAMMQELLTGRTRLV